MPYYECVYIARQDVTQVQVDGLTENFEKIITDQGGSVPKKESWGLRSMAYKIKKNRKGHYVLLNIDATGPAIQEMERQMHLHEDVLRHLVTRVDELEEGPSAVLRAKERGDDRGRGRDRGEDKFQSDSNGETKADTAAEAPEDKSEPKEDAPAADEAIVAEEAVAEDADKDEGEEK